MPTPLFDAEWSWSCVDVVGGVGFDVVIASVDVAVVRSGQRLRPPDDRHAEHNGGSDPRSSMARPQCHRGKVPNGGVFRSSRHRIPDATVPGSTVDPGTARTVGTDAITTGHLTGRTRVMIRTPRGPAAAMDDQRGLAEIRQAVQPVGLAANHLQGPV